MSVEFLTPVGRLVQGGIEMRDKTDDNGQKVLDAQGNVVKECFIAVAFAKTDQAFNALYAQMVAVAKSEFPHLFDAAGNCTHPRFSWKLQDGDGVDSNGQSVANKPGFAGHWILKMQTRFLPKCFHEGKFDPAQQIPNPHEVIKRGYFIRVAGTLAGNGVKPGEQRVPGIFISPNLVSFVAYGPEIQSGPDATKAFGAAPVGALPAGATATPALGGPAATPGPMGGPAALPTAGVATPTPGALPGPAAAMPTPGALPGPAAPAGPQYQMTAAAQGASREQLLNAGLGWTDELLLQQGLMVKIG